MNKMNILVGANKCQISVVTTKQLLFQSVARIAKVTTPRVTQQDVQFLSTG
jgi:hypothetical protein